MSWFVDRLSKKQKKKRKQLRNAAQVGIGLMKSWKKNTYTFFTLFLNYILEYLKLNWFLCSPKGKYIVAAMSVWLSVRPVPCATNNFKTTIRSECETVLSTSLFNSTRNPYVSPVTLWLSDWRTAKALTSQRCDPGRYPASHVRWSQSQTDRFSSGYYGFLPHEDNTNANIGAKIMIDISCITCFVIVVK